MPYVEIPSGVVNTLWGKPLKLPKRDEDGEVIWKDPDKKTEPETVDGDTWLVLEHLILTMNGNELLRRVQKPNDGFNAATLWARVKASRDHGNGYIRVKEEQYKWLHSLLARSVPVTKEAQEQGSEKRSVQSHLFGLDDYSVKQALLSLDERKLDEPDLDDDAPDSKKTQEA